MTVSVRVVGIEHAERRARVAVARLADGAAVHQILAASIQRQTETSSPRGGPTWRQSVVAA